MFAAILSILCGATTFTSCNKTDNPVVVPTPTPTPTPLQREFFPNWNKCEALTVLQEYVEDVTNPKSANFISAEDLSIAVAKVRLFPIQSPKKPIPHKS